jgi:hypothetical protein
LQKTPAQQIARLENTADHLNCAPKVIALGPKPKSCRQKVPVKPPKRPNSAISKNTFNLSALKAIELLRLRKEITARAFRYL